MRVKNGQERKRSRGQEEWDREDDRNICIWLHPFKILKPQRCKVNMTPKLTSIYFNSCS